MKGEGFGNGSGVTVVATVVLRIGDKGADEAVESGEIVVYVELSRIPSSSSWFCRYTAMA
jgi:hypothetical protein